MKQEIVTNPSFPNINFNQLLNIKEPSRWEVLCGDENHWRAGFYSPEFSKEDEILEFENHNCPEFFLLIEGEMSLLLFHEKNREFERINLETGKPIMISAWHNGFCPKGPYTGKALVIERDTFETVLKTRTELIS